MSKTRMDLGKQPLKGDLITITVNGAATECQPNCLILDLLESLSLRGGPIAVERNLQIIPSDQFSNVHLEDGDHLEIVSLTGGG